MNGNLTGIPDKPAFKRDEVIKLTRLDGRVLDYWQKEFGGFVPVAGKTGEPLYTRDDIGFILRIKQWLLIDRIDKSKVKEMVRDGCQPEKKPEKKIPAAAPVVVKEEKRDQTTVSTAGTGGIPREKLKFIRQSLQEILTILDKHDKK